MLNLRDSFLCPVNKLNKFNYSIIQIPKFYHFDIWRFVFTDITYKKPSIRSIKNSDAMSIG